MSIKVTGTMINYYFVCKRKLWYFINNLQMENENQDVIIGKLIDETSYVREKKHITIDETISIDFMEGCKVIHEIKKSDSVEESGIWQMKYSLYILKKFEIEEIRGVIDYPKLRQRKSIELEKNDENRIKQIITEIQGMRNQGCPPVVKSKICKKCAYYELCYI